MEELKIDSFTINPRSIKSDYYEGKITKPERNLLYWLRACGSPYGIATINMEGLADDSFNDSVSKNYINKLLLSLKGKRYIWYSDRSGRRGSFEVHMDYWILPSKQIKRLDRFFDDEGVRGEKQQEIIGISEVESELVEKSQSFESDNIVDSVSESKEKIRSLIRSLNNDNDNDKNKEKDSLQSLSLKNEDYSFSGFQVNSYERMKCKEIAKAVGDSDVAFCYGIYMKNGLGVLERAYKEFQSSDGLKTKENPPAFFNFLVQEQLINSGITVRRD